MVAMASPTRPTQFDETDPLIPTDLESHSSQVSLPQSYVDPSRNREKEPGRGPLAHMIAFLRQLTGQDDSRRSNVGIQARIVSDAIIGLSDGLTVPFALTAGLSSVSGIAARTIIFGGLAELIAGAISMGLGGYLGAISEMHSWKETRRKENIRVAADPNCAMADIKEVFRPYELPESTLDSLALQLSTSPKFVEFIMEFHHGTPEPASARALQSALTIALGYMLGGIIPLIPYFFVGEGPEQILMALWVSVAVMAVALFVFGYSKTCAVSGWTDLRGVKQGLYGGIQMVLVGGAAAGSAVGLVKLFEGLTS